MLLCLLGPNNFASDIKRFRRLWASSGWAWPWECVRPCRQRAPRRSPRPWKRQDDRPAWQTRDEACRSRWRAHLGGARGVPKALRSGWSRRFAAESAKTESVFAECSLGPKLEVLQDDGLFHECRHF